jgi:hypothetical protein
LLQVYADNVNILGGSVHTIKKHRRLVVASKETGLELTAYKTDYMLMLEIRMQDEVTE